MARPRVSVVIPTFNRREQLSGALASVLQQTMPVDEIVVVDDGSTDGTREMLDDFVRLHAEIPIRVIHQENRGPSAARNAGIQAASGDLIAFLDDDDIWLPQKTERQLAVLASDPQLDLLGCGSNIVRMYGGLYVVRIREWAMLFRNWFATPTVIVRREVALTCGGFPEDLRHYEDYALWLKIAGRHRCAFLNEVLVNCGDGKPPFGHSGLSANLGACYVGEREVHRRWRRDRNVGFAVFALVSMHSWARHIRRKIIAARQGT
jgi:glycosyltransferase involved in cell wall biosynthesis